MLITREFVLLIVIANIIAIPIAYYAMKLWLGDFQYQIDLLSVSSILIFILAAFGTLALGVLTVSYQAVTAALINPVTSIAAE